MSHLLSGLVTEADLAAYDRDGAIVVRNVLDMEAVERVRSASARAVEIMLLRNEAQGKPRPTEPAFHNVLFMFRFDPEFLAIATKTNLAKVAGDVMQSDKVILFGDHLLVKEPGTEETTPWHHDLPYWPIRGQKMCSVWLAMDEVTLETGALEYIAGSHKWGRMFQPEAFGKPGKIPGLEELEPIPDIEAERERHTILSWDLKPGDVLVHHPLVVHGAGRNARTDRHRRALSLRYTGDDVRFTGTTMMGGNEGPFAVPLEIGDPLDKNGVYPVALERALT